MFDVITIGDTTTDIFLDIDETTDLCRLNKKKNELILTYGSKIPVKHLDRIPGVGNAANVAVGLRQLGFRTALYTIVGDDAAGKEILRRLRSKKIDLRYAEVDETRGTNSSAVINYQGDRTILAHHEERDYHLPSFPPPTWLYFSSVSGNHDVLNDEIHRFVKKSRCKLAFNPGSVQLRLGAKRLMPILSIADLVILNKQEAERLTRAEADNKKLLRAVHHLGPRLVVITDGRNGSYCFDGNNMYGIGIINLPVIERTGCGDAYASGFLAAVLSHRDVREAMRWGSANGASEATQIGAQIGLLNTEEMKTLLGRHSHFQPTLL